MKLQNRSRFANDGSVSPLLHRQDSFFDHALLRVDIGGLARAVKKNWLDDSCGNRKPKISKISLAGHAFKNCDLGESVARSSKIKYSKRLAAKSHIKIVSVGE